MTRSGGFFYAHDMSKDKKPCECKECVTKRAATKDSVSASGVFTSEILGARQSLTPEGFLLCEEVPIARIGMQLYVDEELPDLEAKDGVIEVEREPEVVFSAETIASFLAKPVTIGHPPDGVNPDNWSVLAKGTAINVRRGEGEFSDFLMADLLVTDKGAINDIRSKRYREISCGYDSDYEQIAPGRARQVTVVGNHVALVESARCGSACSVADSSTKLHGDPPMAAKKGAASIKDTLRKLFMTRDSEGFEKALEEEMKDEEGSGLPAIHIHMPGGEAPAAAPDPKTTDTDPDAPADPMAKVAESLNALTTAVAAIGERVAALEAGKTTDADPDPDADPGTTNDTDPDPDPEKDKTKTGDSAAFRDEFQEAMARAEILAPGVKLPTYDAKADGKKTADSICVLRRRALRASLENDNADVVKTITGDADLTKMTCDAVKFAFAAASELVKQKNMTPANRAAQTADGGGDWAEAQNKRNAEYWSNRK